MLHAVGDQVGSNEGSGGGEPRSPEVPHPFA